jgi:outer membrane protein TolC
MNRLIRAAAAACAMAIAPPAFAQDPAAGGAALTLQEAVALARADQPRLGAYELEARASEQAAIAAQSLPDLRVTAGIQNFPIRGEDAFSPVDSMMTMYTIGVMREQVRRSKRDIEAQRILAEALVSRRQAGAEERRIRLQVMRAWLDAVEARAKQRLLQRLIDDLRDGRKVIEAGVPTGASAPALALEADAEIGLQESLLADARRAEARARAELSRWIGPAADRPLPSSLPTIELPPNLDQELAALAAHPQLQVAAAEQQVAERQIEVAQQERNRDLSWSVMLGIRPKYGEMVSASVSFPLQLNRRNRQDRVIAEAQERAGAARLRLEDARRELERDYRAAVADYRGGEAQLARIEREAVPAIESAFAAAEARYAAGAGTLDKPFAIIRRYVELTMESVEARARRARAAAEILYVVGEAGR